MARGGRFIAQCLTAITQAVSIKRMQDEIIELETKIAFLEKHINELSDALYAQQKQIDTLEEKYRQVKSLVQENAIDGAGDGQQALNEMIDPALEKPPHY